MALFDVGLRKIGVWTRKWFRPLLVALFQPNIPWDYRWRLILMQPIYALSNLLSHPISWPWQKPCREMWIPMRDGRATRALAYGASRRPRDRGRLDSICSDEGPLQPLHVNIHGGAFMGGSPESNHVLDARIARETGAVVVSIEHRCAPEHPFPAAIDDVCEIIEFLRENAVDLLGANPKLMTISGFSAGGNLALAATHGTAEHIQMHPEVEPLKAIILFYAAIDLRLKPQDKPRPEGFPKNDPMAVFLPLFDSYARAARHRNRENPRMNPILVERRDLPERVLMVVPKMDILVAEQLSFANRVNAEDEADASREGPRVEVLYEEKGFHGYLEIHDLIVGKKLKHRAFDRAIEMLQETHREHGFTWSRT